MSARGHHFARMTVGALALVGSIVAVLTLAVETSIDAVPGTADLGLVAACLITCLLATTLDVQVPVRGRSTRVPVDHVVVVSAVVLTGPLVAVALGLVGAGVRARRVARVDGLRLLIAGSNVARCAGAAVAVSGEVSPRTVAWAFVVVIAVDAVTAWMMSRAVPPRSHGRRVVVVPPAVAVTSTVVVVAVGVTALHVATSITPVLALVLAGAASIALAASASLGARVVEGERQLAATWTRVAPFVPRGLDGDADSRLDDHHADVTVLFVDIRGFTSWSEPLRPDELFPQLNALLGVMSSSVASTGGTVDKFTGDGIMAFWGAPTAEHDHAERAVRTIPALVQGIARLNEQRSADGLAPFEVGVGVASGRAAVGIVGDEHRSSYTAIGDTVNVAARLEQATRDLDVPVLVAESTFLRVGERIQRELVRVDAAQVKGRGLPVRTYVPRALHHRPERKPTPPHAA